MSINNLLNPNNFSIYAGQLNIDKINIGGELQVSGNRITNSENKTMIAQVPSKFNLSIGIDTFFNPTPGGGLHNVCVGRRVGESLTLGSNNTSCGSTSFISETTGEYNTSCGYGGLQNQNGSSRNTALGYNAGTLIQSSSDNVLLGYRTGDILTNNNGKNILIGSVCNPIVGTQSNILKIGDQTALSSTNDYIQIGSSTPYTKCYIQGINNTVLTSGKSVVVDTQGQLGVLSGTTGDNVYTALEQDITNKDLYDNSVFFVDSDDITKKIRFDCSNNAPSQTTIYSLPSTNGEINTLNSNQQISGLKTYNNNIRISGTNKILFRTDGLDAFGYDFSISPFCLRLFTSDDSTNERCIKGGFFSGNNSSNPFIEKWSFRHLGNGDTFLYIDNNQVLSKNTLHSSILNSSLTSVGTLNSLSVSGQITQNSGNNVLDVNSIIDASKIANGSVSNTSFQYLANVNDDIQSQLNNSIDLSSVQTLQNKSFIDDNTFIIDNLDNTKRVKFQLTNISTGQTREFQFPNISGNILSNNSTETITNKTIDTDSNTITNIDNNDIKVGANIDISKLGTGLINNTTFNNLQGLTSNIQDQLNTKASLTGFDTLTNKTIDADLNTITNIDNNEIKFGANIDISKLGTGLINNSTFNYLQGLTSNIQGQINSKLNNNDITLPSTFINSSLKNSSTDTFDILGQTATDAILKVQRSTGEFINIESRPTGAFLKNNSQDLLQLNNTGVSVLTGSLNIPLGQQYKINNVAVPRYIGSTLFSHNSSIYIDVYNFIYTNSINGDTNYTALVDPQGATLVIRLVNNTLAIVLQSSPPITGVIQTYNFINVNYASTAPGHRLSLQVAKTTGGGSVSVLSLQQN